MLTFLFFPDVAVFPFPLLLFLFLLVSLFLFLFLLVDPFGLPRPRFTFTAGVGVRAGVVVDDDIAAENEADGARDAGTAFSPFAHDSWYKIGYGFCDGGGWCAGGRWHPYG